MRAQLSALSAAIRSAASVVRIADREREEQRESQLEYEEMLRVMASLGISVAVFTHEVSGAMAVVQSGFARLEKELSVALDHEGLVLIRRGFTRLKDLSGYLGDLISHFASRKKEPVALKNLIVGFLQEFSGYLRDKRISYGSSVNPDYLRTVPMHRTEITSVLFNFMTNSVKALSRRGGLDHRIQVNAFERDRFAVIQFQDNGVGIPEEIRERVFEPFFTMAGSYSDDLVGSGTGLGLKIVRDIAEANGGSVER